MYLLSLIVGVLDQPIEKYLVNFIHRLNSIIDWKYQELFVLVQYTKIHNWKILCTRKTNIPTLVYTDRQNENSFIQSKILFKLKLVHSFVAVH